MTAYHAWHRQLTRCRTYFSPLFNWLLHESGRILSNQRLTFLSFSGFHFIMSLLAWSLLAICYFIKQIEKANPSKLVNFEHTWYFCCLKLGWAFLFALLNAFARTLQFEPQCNKSRICMRLERSLHHFKSNHPEAKFGHLADVLYCTVLQGKLFLVYGSNCIHIGSIPASTTVVLNIKWANAEAVTFHPGH